MKPLSARAAQSKYAVLAKLTPGASVFIPGNPGTVRGRVSEWTMRTGAAYFCSVEFNPYAGGIGCNVTRKVQSYDEQPE